MMYDILSNIVLAFGIKLLEHGSELLIIFNIVLYYLRDIILHLIQNMLLFDRLSLLKR